MSEGTGQVISMPAAPSRTVHTYTFPPSCQTEYPAYQTVSFLELTPDDEIMAAGRAGTGNEGKLAYEKIKAALYALNGKRISLGDGTTDTELAKCPPKVREFIGAAFMDLHSVEKEDVKVFLQSHSAKAG